MCLGEGEAAFEVSKEGGAKLERAELETEGINHGTINVMAWRGHLVAKPPTNAHPAGAWLELKFCLDAALGRADTCGLVAGIETFFKPFPIIVCRYFSGLQVRASSSVQCNGQTTEEAASRCLTQEETPAEWAKI